MPRIVRETLGRDAGFVEPDWVAEDAVAFTAADGELLESLCEEGDVPVELVMRLLDIERASHGLKRRHAVHTRIEEAFRLEWRDHDAVVAERRHALGIPATAAAPAFADDLELPFDPEGEVR